VRKWDWMNDREHLRAIAHGEEAGHPPVQEPSQARESPARQEPPAKKPPDKAKRSTRKIGALKPRRKAV
jgi:hypothetical protein